MKNRRQMTLHTFFRGEKYRKRQNSGQYPIRRATLLKKAGALCLVIALLTGCAPPEEANPIPDAAGRTDWFAERYIELEPVEQLNEDNRRAYPERDTLAAKDTDTPAPAPDATQTPAIANEKVPLNPVQFANTTLYQIADSNYYMNEPAGDNANTRAAIQNGAAFLNELAAQNPTVDFFAYYITRATDGSWFEGYPYFDYYNYLKESLGAASRVQTGHYKLSDLADYYDTGYKTDFHVNYKGSYRVYQDIYAMLATGRSLTPALAPIEELDTGIGMVGDLFDDAAYNSVAWTEEQMDDFIVYLYDIPAYTSYLNDKAMTLGMEAEYAASEVSNDPRFGHQFLYYGGQTGVVRYEFAQPTRPNLLMLSDSQGRPSRLLIASHFNTTVFLDDVQLRNMDLNEVIQQYDIDVVLYTGQRSMFEFYG